MGNRTSTARDEAAAAQSIGHFDHNYDAILIDQSSGMVEAPTSNTPVPAAVQRVLGDGRYVELVMKFDTVQLVEAQKVLLTIPYHGVKTLEWDHSCSSVKITANTAGEEAFCVVKVGNSLELENEAKLRIRGLSRQGSGQQLNLTFAYCGTYAGPTKPKPFQRKRANLSTRPQGKLPPLALMRDLAIARHTGSGAPTRANGSKRVVHALQHIHTGGNTFAVLHAYQRGTAAEHQQGELHEVESKLALSCGTHAQPGLVYVEGQRALLSFGWADVRGWVVHDRVHAGEMTSGVEITFHDNATWFFVVLDVLHLKDAIEHFWNRHHAPRPPKPQSTHGRDIVTVTTLHGEIAAPPKTTGDLDITDEMGTLVRSSGTAHGGVAKRKSSVYGSMVKGKKPTGWSVNARVEKHWDSVVVHQGWLLKKGGLAKSWIKRYAVLYRTAMGHFLCYYADFAKSPLFHDEERERRIIDLCKVTFVRPVSNHDDVPPNSFDICTIEREWTLSAESKTAMQRWLQVVTRAIDEDTAIVPDDELVFTVKPRVDPSQQLVKNEYSTALKVSASGVSVCAVTAADELVERFFWCYTDFFKWSILHHSGKTGLQVSVFTSADFDVKDRHEFLFRTRDAVKLATAIEFYIEKFMSIMHLYLEGGQDAGGASAMAMSPTEMATNNLLGEDDMLALGGEDDDRTGVVSEDHVRASDVPPPAPNNQGILDLFTVPAQTTTADPFAYGSAPPPKPYDALADDVSALSMETGFPPQTAAPVRADVVEEMTLGDAKFDALAVGAAAGANRLKGVLYEDPHVAVAIEHDYRGSEGRITVRIANKCSTPIDSLRSDLDAGETGLRYEFGAPSSTSLQPGEAAAQLLMLECMKPFDGIAALVVSFRSQGVPYEVRLALPCVFTKFLEPVQLSPNVFVQRWATLGAPGLEHMVTFAATAGPATAAFAKPRLADLVRVAVVEGVDDNSGTILSGATALRTGTVNAGGEKISVGCLIRLEMNEGANAFRLTVRTAVPHVSTALSEAIQKLL